MFVIGRDRFVIAQSHLYLYLVKAKFHLGWTFLDCAEGDECQIQRCGHHCEEGC